ncbi:MAG: MFS transporter [Dehalococcoidia bacterium]|nr:MFS transporter [Dehalococcoidia bacterium]
MAINIFWGGVIQQGFTVFFNPIKESLGLPALLVTLAFQLRAVTAILGSPLIGVWFDRFGPRGLMIGSGVVTAGGMLFLSFASNYATFFLALLLTSVGSTVWMAGVGPATIANWFVRRRGIAIGLVLGGISLGGMSLLMGERKLQGSIMGSNRFRVDMPRYIEFYQQGRLKLDEMITRRGRLEDVNKAFQAMKNREVARTVLTFE